jgi:hypothetical protein
MVFLQGAHMNLPSRQSAVALGVAVAAILGLVAVRAPAGQRAAEYTPPAFQPRFVETGPDVAIDGGHRELHTIDGGYAPLARLLRQDGMQVRALGDATLRPGSLAGVDVLVVSNARPPGEAEDALAGDAQAFTGEETVALDRWVSRGGSLLLVADHYPFGGYVRTLSERFGVRMGGGYAADAEHACGRRRRRTGPVPPHDRRARDALDHGAAGHGAGLHRPGAGTGQRNLPAAVRRQRATLRRAGRTARR